MSEKRVLVVEADPVIRSGMCNFLAAHGHVVSDACNCHEAQLQLHHFRPDAAILDLSLPNGDAPQLLRQIKAQTPGIPVLVLTGQGNSEAGARAIQQGAEQLLTKPVELATLQSVLLRMMRQPLPIPRLPVRECLDPFVGSSVAMRRLRDIAAKVATSESPVLLQGETGAGKGVLAHWIHQHGPRAQQPFVDLNCAGLSRELLESELFGHEKGAFTSAVSRKQGLLEVADRGTVLLDEIGDIDLQVQPKLLKVLEDRAFRRRGDVRDRSVDIRLISATHRELLELVRQERFRADLYFRVNIVYIRVPPLRERVEDIPTLAQTLLASLSRTRSRHAVTLTPSTLQVLQRYPWPGNIRELRNVLERSILVSEAEELKPEHLHFAQQSPASSSGVSNFCGTLKQVERDYIRHVLHDESGSIDRTARRLGIPRSSLYNKMRRFEIPAGTGRM